MLEKFNWGHGIFLFYVIFVGVVATALIASFSVDHSLVEDDYYAHDLAYQKTYDKMKNSMESEAILIERADDILTITFPESQSIDGKIHFYRASDKSMDFEHSITKTTEKISLNNVAKGKWKLKIHWTIQNTSYFKEEEIFI